MKNGSFGEFLWLLLGSFFKWWWAVITGVASILSYLALPSGLTLGRLWASVAVLVASTLLFLTVTVVHQGWLLYRGSWNRFRLTRWQRSAELGADHVFLVDDCGLATVGSVAELRRFHDSIEVTFGLIEFVARDSKNMMQAKEVWLEPSHVRELRTGQLSVPDVSIRYPVSRRSMDLWAVRQQEER